MDKKSIAAVAIVGIVIIALLVFLFIGDATSNTILTVGKTDYELDDFISYVRTWEKDGFYSDFDTYKQNNASTIEEGFSESDYMSTIFSSYEVYKLYAQVADNLKVTLDDSEIPTVASGDAEELMNDYSITSGEYIRVRTEEAKANKLYSSPSDYITLTDDITNSYLAAKYYDPQKVYTTFKYRVVQLPVDQVDEATDETADSGEEAERVSGEKARVLAEAKEKADALLGLVKDYSKDFSGDTTFDEFQNYVASKDSEVLNSIFADMFASGDDGESYGVYDYIASAVSYPRYSKNLASVENGELDSVSALYMESDLGSSSGYLSLFVGNLYTDNVIPFLSSAKSGDYSEVFGDNDSGYVGFAYLDDIEYKLSDEDQARFDSDVLNYYIQSSYELTQKNTARIRELRLSEIIPLIARQEAEKQNTTSGDSGEVISLDNYADYVIPEDEESLNVSGEIE